tara:strand:- start:210 stop:833 length:624 start_codon:yes stop_codon:yes gene_type:complete
MDSTNCNYDPAATCDLNGDCDPVGCTDPTAFNYDPIATCDDSSCVAVVNGCTDATACNYDALANTDDGSCTGVEGCMYPSACNYDSTATCDLNNSCIMPDGCTDSLAINYDPSAVCDDGSCEYAVAIDEFEANLSIYPNPANDFLNITNDGVVINTISIFNLNGQEVLNSEVNANEIRLNTSNISKGLYIIEIRSNDVSTKRKLSIQ